MAHPLAWLWKYFFYPIGNTSAICLTQDLSVEQPADVLLLGCGDPRNVLYTVYADLKLETGDIRKLDITCCDIEPAILARNVLLYALICTSESIDIVWNIFYHFYIDAKSADVLVRQCRLLVAAAQSLDSWGTSQYGAYMKMCSSYTLEEMRRHWELYAAFSTLPHSRLDALVTQQKKLSEDLLAKYSTVLSVSRSAGMHWPQAVKTMNNLHRQYWKTGTTFLTGKDRVAATKLNPTFVYNLSGENFIPHYGTFPPQAFHLESAFVPVVHDTGKKDMSPTVMDVVKRQFMAWCGAFKVAVGPSRALVTRFCVGDVLNFCKSLQCRGNQGAPRLLISPLSARLLELDAMPIPSAFDVIDTSNLTDHMGLLNILLVSKPLLKSGPTSVLYTETLLPAGADAKTALLGRICGDVPIISLLIGLTPRSLLSGFTTNSNGHELLFNQSDKQYHERVVWCAPTAGDPLAPGDMAIAIDATALGHMLFKVYDQMCADERVFDLMQDPRSHMVTALPHYDRASFALLVRMAKARVVPSNGDWDKAIDVLLETVEQDRDRLVGMNNYQELCLQLHLHGVFTTSPLSPLWCAVNNVANNDAFREWNNVPPIVCVVLVVPRDRLTVLSGKEHLGSLPVMCRLLSAAGHDNFFACGLQIIPGSIIPTSRMPPQVDIMHDARSYTEAPSLVLAFLAPAWLLTLPRTRVAFTLKSTPNASFTFLHSLGPSLNLFSAPLTDRKHVRIVADRPGVLWDSGPSEQLPPVRPGLGSPAETIVAQMDQSYISMLTMTATVQLKPMGFTSPIDESLPVQTRQISACAMELAVGDRRKHVLFPYPIKGDKHRLRIARKSLYIGIMVPPFRPTPHLGYTFHGNPFPITPSLNLTPWNIHHVNLDTAPILDMKGDRELDWVHTHSIPASEVLTSLKHPIQCMFVKCATSPHHRVFRYVDLASGVPSLFIFVHHVRLDLAAFTILLDAAVLPYHYSLRDTLSEITVLSISSASSEVAAWRQLLPAAVERCRTWPHGPNCEYASAGWRIPLSLEASGSPICSCGRSAGLPERMPGVQDAAWMALRPYATRAALSPLFAVSYLAQATEGEKEVRVQTERPVPETLSESTAGTATDPSASGSEACLACGGPEKPKLLTCSRCKWARYCSSKCSKGDWKAHKPVCQPA